MKEYNLLMKISDNNCKPFSFSSVRASPIKHLIIIGEVGVVIGDEMLSALREAFDAGLTVHLRAESGEKP